MEVNGFILKMQRNIIFKPVERQELSDSCKTKQFQEISREITCLVDPSSIGSTAEALVVHVSTLFGSCLENVGII